MLRETAAFSGLVDGVNAALIDTYRGPPIHAPGTSSDPRNPEDTGHHAGDPRAPAYPYRHRKINNSRSRGRVKDGG